MFFKHHQRTCETKPYRGQQKHQCAQLVFLFLFSMSHLALVAKQPKPDYCRKIVVSELFLFYSSCAQDSVHHFCPISVSPKNRAQKRALFPKTTSPFKNSGLRAKRHLKNTHLFIKYTFLGLTNCQLVKQVFGWYWEGNPLSKKPYFYSVFFFENNVKKELNFLPLCPKKTIFWKDAE